MKYFTNLLRALGALAIAAAACSAHAQATRTWVSGVGDDVNPCSRTAPCKTFAGAISKTAAGGIINVIDPGAYGTVTITKSITIDGNGSTANVLGGTVNGINITAAASDLVILRNLSIAGTTGTAGIQYNSGGYVVIENVRIDGFANGINMNTSTINGRMDVRNTQITGSTTGINIGGRASLVSLSGVTVRGTTTGLSALAGEVNVRDSDFVNNGTAIYSGGGRTGTVGNNRLFGNGNDGRFQVNTRAD